MFRAKLDSSGLLLGLEEVAELLEGDIELGGDCGLKAGKYRWDGATFVPLPKSQHRADPNVPSYEDALFALISEISPTSPQCKAWADYYQKTIGGVK